VDLTARLREILLNYPEGTSILKELVQNAVRARHVSIPPSRIVSGVPTSPVL
jgi:sacsin